MWCLSYTEAYVYVRACERKRQTYMKRKDNSLKVEGDFILDSVWNQPAIVVDVFILVSLIHNRLTDAIDWDSLKMSEILWDCISHRFQESQALHLSPCQARAEQAAQDPTFEASKGQSWDYCCHDCSPPSSQAVCFLCWRNLQSQKMYLLNDHSQFLPINQIQREEIWC